jgi:hypothetical protein
MARAQQLSGQAGSPASVALARSQAVLAKVNAPDAVTSAGIYSRRCDPHAIRRKFPEKWSGFLRAHFRDHVEVAYVFSVDAKTARHWWEGSYGPQGWAVDFAHRQFPNARQWMDAA